MSQFFRVESLMLLGQHEELAIRIDGSGDSPPRVGQQCPSSEKRAELFRAIVAASESRERLQACSIAARENDTPTALR